MPNELRLQSLVVNSVKQSGGFAFKMSNRFLIGVPDLFVHFPSRGTSLWEVKSIDLPSADKWNFDTDKGHDAKIMVKPTMLQKQFLAEYDGMNGVCGVISFVEGKSRLYVAVFRYKVIVYSDYYLPAFETSSWAYTELKRGIREKTMAELVERAYGGRPD